jgi:hypothetical protein
MSLGNFSEVRCGSKPALTTLKQDFRNTRESRHSRCSLVCLNGAIKRHRGLGLNERPPTEAAYRRFGLNARSCFL